jgi:hypothetical protein
MPAAQDRGALGHRRGPPIQLASTGLPSTRAYGSQLARAVSVGSVIACGVRMTSSRRCRVAGGAISSARA